MLKAGLLALQRLDQAIERFLENRRSTRQDGRPRLRPGARMRWLGRDASEGGIVERVVVRIRQIGLGKCCRRFGGREDKAGDILGYLASCRSPLADEGGVQGFDALVRRIAANRSAERACGAATHAALLLPFVSVLRNAAATSSSVIVSASAVESSSVECRIARASASVL